jgi:hypothetical protein
MAVVYEHEESGNNQLVYRSVNHQICNAILKHTGWSESEMLRYNLRRGLCQLL